MKLRSKKGFSLVELIIVIAIMGIIAVIAVPNLTGIQQRSQVNADIRTAETIAKSLAIAVAEGRTVTQNATTKSVENALSSGWIKLGALETSISGIDFDEYIDTSLKPKATGSVSGDYYVKSIAAAEAGGTTFSRIVVAVGNGTFTETSQIPYDGEISTNSAEIACIDGLELSTTNIAKYYNK